VELGGQHGQGPTCLIDCRWIGFTGIGRITEFLLEGMQEREPSGHWILWGPPSVRRFLWPGATAVASVGSPLRWAGQRSIASAPRADITFFPHVVRPLGPRRSLVLVQDTIPLRWSPRSIERALWRGYFTLSAHAASSVLAASPATAARVEQDLGVTTRAVVSYPVDARRGARLRELRRNRRGGCGGEASGGAQSRNSRGPLVYVGRVRPHKNLVRAVKGFARSTFAKDGGRFVIAGADALGHRQLEAVLQEPGAGGVEVIGPRSEAELDDLYADAGFVIQPSLEEGYGLGVTEALAAGIPVCCSAVSPLLEVADDRCELFDPASVEAIRAAIDRTAALATSGYVPHWPEAPTPGEFADEIIGHIAAALREV
jgi:glycosyltransferase involved in cell wall biosynthesis